MRAPVVVMLLLTGLLLMRTGAAQAQAYRLLSWEGKPVIVSVSNRQPFIHHIAVSCAADTVFLLEHQYTESVRVLQNRFLQVTYGTRCGSGCEIKNTALLSVRNGKLSMSLMIMSYNEWATFSPGEAESRRYSVALETTRNLAGTHFLQARVHEEFASQREPSKTHVINRLVTLPFDTARQVFYSALEFTARALPVFSPEIHNTPDADYWLSPLRTQPDAPYVPTFPVVPRYILGTFPVVRLVGSLYYFIDGEWYGGNEKVESDDLDWFTQDAYRYGQNGQRKPAY